MRSASASGSSSSCAPPAGTIARPARDTRQLVADAIGFAEWIVEDPDRRKKGLEQARRDMDMVRSCYHPDATDAHGHYNGDVEGFIQQSIERWSGKSEGEPHGDQ